MESSPQEKEKLREIVRHLIANDQKWFQDNDIIAQEKGGFWILNYNQFGGVNEYNQLTRGLVVSKPEGAVQDPLQLIKSFPFSRFFNRHEPTAAKIDFSDSEALEKLDGSFVGVYFPTKNPNDPHWHTRRMLSTHQPDIDMPMTGFHGKTHKLIELIGSYVKKINYRQKDTDYTLVFEFIHEATQVWTKYGTERYGLHLTGARYMPTFYELNEQELDDLAKELNVPRPQRWSASNDEAINALMKQMAQEISGFEGFVFRDKKTGKRVKLKDEDYVKMHHLLSELSFKNLLQKVLDGEAEEIVSYFPTAKEKVDIIKEKYNALVAKMIAAIKKWKVKNLDRKTLALSMLANDGEKESYIRSAVFRYIDEPEDKVHGLIEKELHAMSNKNIRKLIQILDLKDDSDETHEE